jgi:hypothetical protein
MGHAKAAATAAAISVLTFIAISSQVVEGAAKRPGHPDGVLQYSCPHPAVPCLPGRTRRASRAGAFAREAHHEGVDLGLRQGVVVLLLADVDALGIAPRQVDQRRRHQVVV